MPDGKRCGSKSDKELKSETPKDDFLYRDNGEYDEEATAEAVRRACCFNFNNFIHSAQLMTKAMEPNNSDGDDSGMKRERCNSGDSDLVVLSVVLNKKHKENDEVAKAIERLRQNGVNCVIFTMSDIRNGNTKADGCNCGCFGFSAHNHGIQRTNNVHCDCPCIGSQENCLKSEDHQISTISIQTPLKQSPNLVNISPTPSPSPQNPSSPAAENNFLDGTNQEPIIVEPVTEPTKRKQRRKRKYPYSTRKLSRPKPKKARPNIVESNADESSNCRDADDTFPNSSSCNEKKEDSLEIQPGATKITVDTNGFKNAKRKGRKTKGEKFEEAFQIAVQSFVETTKEKHNKARHRICIPGAGRSIYTRSSKIVNLVEPSVGNLDVSAPRITSSPKHQSTSLAKQHGHEGNVKSECNRRKPGRPKKLNAAQNVKAICIRNIFIGPSVVEHQNIVDVKTVNTENTTDKNELNQYYSRLESSQVSTQFKNQELLVTMGQKNNEISKPLKRENIRSIANNLNSPVNKHQENEGMVKMIDIDNNSEIESLSQGQTYVCTPEIMNAEIVLEDQAGCKVKAMIHKNIQFQNNLNSYSPSSHVTALKNNFNKTENDHVRRDHPTSTKQQRAFSPDITSRARGYRRRKFQVKKTNVNALVSSLHEDQELIPKKMVLYENSLQTTNKSSPTVEKYLLPHEPNLMLAQAQEVKDTLDALISSVVFCTEMELTIPESIGSEWDDMPDIRKQSEGDNKDLLIVKSNGCSETPPVLTLEVNLKPTSNTTQISHVVGLGSEDSLPDVPDSMQLRRSSFYPLVTGNVRVNLENYLDGMIPNLKFTKRKKRLKNGFLLHHGDNCPEHPESPYRLHLATQVLLKLNRRRSKCKPKEERTKNLLSYLKLTPRRPVRLWKSQAKVPEEYKSDLNEEPVFSGEWGLIKKYICGVCGQSEKCFWDMVTHKGEEHPGVVVTHVELPPKQQTPASLIRKTSEKPASNSSNESLVCTKCSTSFSTLSDLHSHIFECAGNISWLVEKSLTKRKPRRRGFKRRFSNTQKKQKRAETTKRRTSDLHKCLYCTREFKTEGWLKNHMTSHSLPISIPLDKLPLASLPVRASLKKSTTFTHHLRNSPNQIIG